MQIEGSVIVCDSIDEKGIEILKKAGLTVDYLPKITKEIIQNAKGAKIIARVGVGLDNIDTDEAKNNNIEVINAGEASVNAVSELVLGFIFSLSRNITIANKDRKSV